MSSRQQISRREFLQIVVIATSTTILGSCTPNNKIETSIPFPPTQKPIIETKIPILPTNIPTKEPVKAISPAMVFVEAGSFQMGSIDGYPDEQPVHTVDITKSFYTGKYAVTFDEYDLFCEDMSLAKPDDRGWGRGDRPVIHVDFYDVTAYCNWLSEKEGLSLCYSGKGKLIQCDFSATGYRLPTEAEWEYAARGGQKSLGYTYAGSNNPNEVGWYEENSNGKTQPVGKKQPNELGIFDMSGNLYEWCWDWYSEEYYVVSPSADPQGPPPPKTSSPFDLNRVRRSGYWQANTESIRTAFRSYDSVSYPGGNGFRLARTAASL